MGRNKIERDLNGCTLAYLNKYYKFVILRVDTPPDKAVDGSQESNISEKTLLVPEEGGLS